MTRPHSHTVHCPCGSAHTTSKRAPDGYRYVCPDCGRILKVFPHMALVLQPGDPR